MKNYNEILNNDINGNMSIYRSQLKKLSKIQLLEYIEHVHQYDDTSNDTTHTIRKIKRNLEI